jgi:hypothetical protein
MKRVFISSDPSRQQSKKSKHNRKSKAKTTTAPSLIPILYNNPQESMMRQGAIFFKQSPPSRNIPQNMPQVLQQGPLDLSSKT